MTPKKQAEKIKAEPLPTEIHKDAGKVEKPRKMRIEPEDDVMNKTTLSGPKTPT